MDDRSHERDDRSHEPDESERVEAHGHLMNRLMTAAGLSDRLGRLVREVIDCLPPGWDEYRTVGFVESEDVPPPGIGYAKCLQDDYGETEITPETQQTWEITLYVKRLAPLSDSAVRWVIAHELGHVTSDSPSGSGPDRVELGIF